VSTIVPPDASATTQPRSIVDRVKTILLQPKSEWPVIDAEPATVASIYSRYVAILAAIPAVCGAIGLSAFGTSMPFGGSIRWGVGFAIRVAVIQYVASLIGIYVLALIIDGLAPSFGGQKDQIRALKVAAYSATASWVVGLVGLVPALGILRLLGLYSLYLLYTGLPVLMKAPADRAQGYTIVVIIAAIVVFLLIGVVATRLGGAF
jgi:Yip1 domain